MSANLVYVQAALALIRADAETQFNAARAVYNAAVASNNINAMGNAEITLGQVWQAGNAVIKAAELAVKNAENELAYIESSSAQA